MKTISLLLLTFVFAVHLACGQSSPEKYAADVKTIDAIITAYYDVVSGSSTDPWQFERDQYIH